LHAYLCHNNIITLRNIYIYIYARPSAPIYAHRCSVCVVGRVGWGGETANDASRADSRYVTSAANPGTENIERVRVQKYAKTRTVHYACTAITIGNSVQYGVIELCQWFLTFLASLRPTRPFTAALPSDPWKKKNSNCAVLCALR